jgi:hypothetical protein
MAWKKVVLSTTSDQMVFVQNTSAIKNSIVRLAFTETDMAPTGPTGVFILSGPNTWNGRIKKGSYMWYEEQLGGIFTYTSYDINTVHNYSITPVHKDIVTNNDVIDVPEGAYFVIQNKSDDSVFFSVNGDGTFVLTKNQMLSFSFTRDTQVRIKSTGKDISYYYSEAPSITQLSASMQNTIDNIKAAVELLKGNVVTRRELQEVNKKTYYDRYSADVSATLSVIDPTLPALSVELPLLETDEDFDSEQLREKEILDFIISVKYFNGTTETEAVTNISARISKNDLVLPIIDMDTYDPILSMILEEIKLEWNEDQGTLLPTIIFGNWMNTNTSKYKNIKDIFKAPITVSLRVKSELAVWKASNKVFTPKNTNRLIHANNKFNKRTHFTTNTSYDSLFTDISRTLYSKHKDIVFDIKSNLRATKTTDTGSNTDTYTIADANDKITVRLIKTPTDVNLEVLLKDATADDGLILSSISVEDLVDPYISFNLNLDLLEKTKTPRVINKTSNPFVFGTSLYIPKEMTSEIYTRLFDRFITSSNSLGLIKIVTRKED